MAYIGEHWKCQIKLTEVFGRLDAKRVYLLLGGSGYDHESNGRTKRIKLDHSVKIRNESVFFKYPKLEIDLVDYNNRN